MAKPTMDDYVDVASRIAAFFDKYPDGSLEPQDPTVPWEVREVGGKVFVVYTAVAYRTPDDQRPGIGCAWEPFPGPTQFTRDSELMNAETGAWGRALAALGFEVRKGIATRQDVEKSVAQETARQAVPLSPRSTEPDPAKRTLRTGEITRLTARLDELGVDDNALTLALSAAGVDRLVDLTVAEAQSLVAGFSEPAVA